MMGFEGSVSSSCGTAPFSQGISLTRLSYGGFFPLLPGPLHAQTSATAVAVKQSFALMAVVKNYTPRCSYALAALVAFVVVGTQALLESSLTARRSRNFSRCLLRSLTRRRDR